MKDCEIKKLEKRVQKLEKLIINHAKRLFVSECGFRMPEREVKKILED